MSTDWQEKEREFLTSLKADTGRDLGEWMRVVAAQNLPHRNDIIDWLRQQGFPFSKASWLERIHHNNGRPIYLDPAQLEPSAGAMEDGAQVMHRVAAAGGGRAVHVPATTCTPPQHSPAPARRDTVMPPPRLAAETPPLEETPAAEPVAQTSQARPEGAPPSVAQTEPPIAAPASAQSLTGECGLSREEVLAKAKAYRPLGQHLLRQLEGAITGLDAAPAPGHLLLRIAGVPFGLVAISAKDIRLVLRLGPDVASAVFVPVKLPVTLARAAQDMTHMAVLTDARQIDDTLINLVRQAATAAKA